MHSWQAPLPAEDKCPFTDSGKTANCPSTGLFHPENGAASNTSTLGGNLQQHMLVLVMSGSTSHVLCNSSSPKVLGLQACKADNWLRSKGTDYG